MSTRHTLRGHHQIVDAIEDGEVEGEQRKATQETLGTAHEHACVSELQLSQLTCRTGFHDQDGWHETAQ